MNYRFWTAEMNDKLSNDKQSACDIILVANSMRFNNVCYHITSAMQIDPVEHRRAEYRGRNKCSNAEREGERQLLSLMWFHCDCFGKPDQLSKPLFDVWRRCIYSNRKKFLASVYPSTYTPLTATTPSSEHQRIIYWPTFEMISDLYKEIPWFMSRTSHPWTVYYQLLCIVLHDRFG